jgi:hypothetical protein
MGKGNIGNRRCVNVAPEKFFFGEVAENAGGGVGGEKMRANRYY